MLSESEQSSPNPHFHGLPAGETHRKLKLYDLQAAEGEISPKIKFPLFQASQWMKVCMYVFEDVGKGVLIAVVVI